MTFVPTPNAARASLVYSLSDQTIVNTLWFLFVNQNPSETDLADLAGALNDWWDASVKDLLVTNISLVEINVIDQSSDQAPSITLPVGSAGTVTGTPVPLNTAVVVSFRSSGRGRSQRGRNYLTGFDRANQVSAAGISTTFAAAIQTAYAALNSYTNPEGWYHIISQKWSNKVQLSVGIAHFILTYTVNVQYDSMRTRLSGRGQ